MAAFLPSAAAAAEGVPGAGDPGRFSLTALAASVNLADEVATSLWEHLELDPATDAEIAANIPQEDLKKTLRDFIDSRGLSAGVSGRISTLFVKLERHRAAVDDPAPPTAAPPQVAAVAAAPRGKLSEVLDQYDDSTYEELDLDTRAALRRNHEAATGGPPPVGKEPSSDQLAAMMARIKKKHAPYADFAIFTPHGRRLVKYHKFDAQVFVQGTLQTQRLKGPQDFAAWQSCWAVFRATMISLSEASPATLDDYERGLAQLHSLNPSQWGILFCADEILRSEVWQKVQHDMQDKGTWPDFRPWDQVIKITTYGGPESTYVMQHWWSTHVLFPCQQAKPLAFLHGIEGTTMLPMPSGMTNAAASSSGGDTRPHGRPQQDHSQSNQQGGHGNSHKKKNKNKPARPYTTPDYNHNSNKGKGKGKGHQGGKTQEGKGHHGGKNSKK